MQGSTTLDHLDEAPVDLRCESGQGRCLLGQTTAIALNPQKMSASLRVALFHQLGEGQHKRVSGVNEVAVARNQVLLNFRVNLQKMPIQEIRVILGVLEPQSRVNSTFQLHQAERFGEVTRIWLESTAQPFTWEDQPAILALLTDITERKLAELGRPGCRRQ